MSQHSALWLTLTEATAAQCSRTTGVRVSDRVLSSRTPSLHSNSSARLRSLKPKSSAITLVRGRTDSWAQDSLHSMGKSVATASPFLQSLLHFQIYSLQTPGHPSMNAPILLE